MGEPFGTGGLAALAVIALLALFIVLRFTSLAAEVAILIERLVKGPQSFYGEDRSDCGTVARFGRTRTELAPHGKVFVAGELWDAVAEGPIPAGSRVEVTGREGLILRVRPAGPKTNQERG